MLHPSDPSSATRRPAPLLVAVLLLAVIAAGCASDASGAAGTAPEEPASAASAPAETAVDATFPVTIPHVYGETTIDAEPQRVVTVGWASADASIAVGVVPVAIPHQAYGGDERGLLPWIEEALEAQGAEVPTILPAGEEIPFEAIAAAQPDVILAHYSGITDTDYELLAGIAPTVAFPEVAWSTPWRDVITITGQALGREAEAQAVLDDIESAVEQAAADHPEFSGLTFVHGGDDGSAVYVYRDADPRVEFVTDLGMEVAPSVEEMANGESSFYYTISYEEVDRLSSDILIVSAETAADAESFLTDGATASMPQVREGRVAVIEGAPLVAAVSPPTALSLTWGLDAYLAALSEAACAATTC